MSDHADSHAGRDSPEAQPTEPAGVESVEIYETDDGVVFYDAENPLAWMEATRTLSLDEQC